MSVEKDIAIFILLSKAHIIKMAHYNKEKNYLHINKKLLFQTFISSVYIQSFLQNMHVNQILFPYHTKIGILREIF